MASDLIDHNPLLKKPAMTVLGVCVENAGASRAVVEERALALWSDAFRQVPASVIDALVREGYLREQIVVDGSPYDGMLEDAYLDDAIPDEAEVDALVFPTDEAARVLEEYAPEATLAGLYEDRPTYIPVFDAVLGACAADGGATREQLEHAVEAAIEAHSIRAVGGAKVFPQYFLDALETAGGIEWEGAWRITEAGRGRVSNSPSL